MTLWTLSYKTTIENAWWYISYWMECCYCLYLYFILI